MQADMERGARDGDVATIEDLLQRGEDVDARDRHGQTVGDLAAELDMIDLCREMAARQRP